MEHSFIELWDFALGFGPFHTWADKLEMLPPFARGSSYLFLLHPLWLKCHVTMGIPKWKVCQNGKYFLPLWDYFGTVANSCHLRRFFTLGAFPLHDAVFSSSRSRPFLPKQSLISACIYLLFACKDQRPLFPEQSPKSKPCTSADMHQRCL